MALQLQHRGRKFRNIIFLDSSPELVVSQNAKVIEADQDQAHINVLLDIIIKHNNELNHEEIKSNLARCTSFEDRYSLTASLLYNNAAQDNNQSTQNNNQSALENTISCLKAIWNKTILSAKYQFDNKLNSNVLLIRAKEPKHLQEHHLLKENDYGLSKVIVKN